MKKIKTGLRDRPQRLWQYGRGYLLFQFTKLISPLIFSSPRYEFGTGVRLQNVASLLASDMTARIRIGADTIIYENARLDAAGEGQIHVGPSSILGDIKIFSRARVTLGARCLTSWNVLIQDFDSHPVSQCQRADQMRQMVSDFHPRFATSLDLPIVRATTATASSSAEIRIGDDVWIGAGAIILKGTRIGDGSIVGAGSVVVGGEFPPRSLIAGNPARRVKELPT